MSRIENIAVFEDTVSVCEKSSRLIDGIKASRKTQIFIGEGEKLSDANKTPRFEKEAEIKSQRSELLKRLRTMQSLEKKLLY